MSRIKDAFDAVAAAIIAQKDYLSNIDAKAGDGDHGFNMARRVFDDGHRGLRLYRTLVQREDTRVDGDGTVFVEFEVLIVDLILEELGGDHHTVIAGRRFIIHRYVQVTAGDGVELPVFIVDIVVLKFDAVIRGVADFRLIDVHFASKGMKCHASLTFSRFHSIDFGPRSFYDIISNNF